MRSLPRRAVLLWLRATARRPLRGLLVVVGLLAMSLATTASLVAADSLDRWFVADARASYPGIDIEVTSARGAVFSQGLASRVADSGDTRAWVPRLLLPAVALFGDARQPNVTLAGLTPEGEPFTAPRALTGTTDVEQLGPSDVVLNERLARRLGAQVGDDVRLVAAVPQVREFNERGVETRRKAPDVARALLRVAGVSRDEGVADLGRAPVAYLRLDQLQRITGLGGKVTVMHAATADGQHSARAADRLVDLYRPAASTFGLRVAPVRADALDTAREEAGLFRGILLTLALLVAAASVAVTANLLVLLAQERAREVAALRVLGARQGAVAGLLTAEGSTYAVVAALLGAALGIPLGDRLARLVGDDVAALSRTRGRDPVEIALDARLGTVLLGAALVVGVALATTYLVGRRVAARPLDTALRGAPGPPASVPTGKQPPRRVIGAGLLLLGMGLTAAVAGDLYRFLGLSLLLTGLWLRRRRRAKDAAALAWLDARAAAVALLWCLGAPAVLGDFSRGVQTGFGLLAAAGALAVGAATILLTTRLRLLTRVVQAVLPGRRLAAALRVAGASGEAARARSGTVMASVGVVVFMVAALAVLGSATSLPLARQGGGFDAVAVSVAPLDPDALAREASSLGAEGVSVTESVLLPERAYGVAPEDTTGRGLTVPYPVRLTALDEALLDLQGFGLAAAVPGITSAEQALRAVALDPGAAVIDRYARPEGAAPGDEVVVETATGPRRLRLLAVLDTFVLRGVYVSPSTYSELVPSRGRTLVLAAAAPGVSPVELAQRLEQRGRLDGMTAQTVEQVADEVTRANRAFTDVFGLLLQAGLAVALVAVGVLLSRAARERRAELAVLRALGFRRRSVALALAVEPLLAGTVGLVLGVVVGLGVLRLLFLVGFSDLAFQVDGPGLLRTVLGVELLLAVVCALAAGRAGRGDPAATLRDLG